ncbi:MAG: T9SS C-terminal target domain-containing protein, partial [Bacteroidetes bacterium]
AIGARHENPDQNFVNKSQYIVLSIPAPFGPENPESASPTWFKEESRSEYQCDSGCDVWLTEDPPIRELDEKIAGGEVDPGVHSAPMIWMLERNLYRKLYNDPSLIQSGSVIDSFYSAKAGTTMAQLVEAETAIHDLYELDAGTVTQLETYRTQLVSSMEEVMNIDSLLQTASGQDSLDLLVQRASAAQAIDSLSQLNTALVNSILQNRSNAADAVIAQNDAIVTSYIWESNEKTVNDILLNTLVKGLLPDSVQINTLGGIARQCPYEGGTAVFRARAILEGLTGEAFDDEVLCAEGQQGLVMPPGVNTIPFKTIVAYPNPAHNVVTVRFAHKIDQGQQMALLSPLGQTLQVYDLPEGDIQFNMDISGMPQGIYYLKLFGNCQQTEIIKLVIQER